MGIRLGIDMGISSTKVAGICNNDVFFCKTVEDARRHNIGLIIDSFTDETSVKKENISSICATGVNALSANTNRINVCDEFTACILGAKFNNPVKRFIIAGFGTGTPFIMVDGNKSRHLGGFGIGGGTLTGLARILLGDISMEQLSEMALKGDSSKVNILIGDVCSKALPNLPLDTTASNFGKVMNVTSREDIASGLVKLVIETIGSAANLASQICGIRDIITIGRLATFPPNRKIFDTLETLYNIRFHIPEHCSYRTAIGAALYCPKNIG